MPKFSDGPVNLLWLIPISESERQPAESEGVDQLEEHLQAAGVGWLARSRKPVIR
jgi:hypothetical protein